MNTAALHGVLLLDKPLGLSSNQALAQVKRLLGVRKAGHTGALDPLATGMLPCCLGEATKIAGVLLGARKAYRAELRLGVATSTEDAEGEVVARMPVPDFDDAALERALAALRGTIEQRPPMYAALKHQGQRLYRLARRGVQLELPPRAVSVYALRAQRLAADTLALELVCGPGTYVRSLGRDLARALGTCGHLVALRRLWVEPYVDRPMYRITDLEQLIANDPTRARGVLLPIPAALPGWPQVSVSAEQAARLRAGQPIRGSQPGAAGDCLVVDTQGAAVALAVRDGSGQITARRVFAC